MTSCAKHDLPTSVKARPLRTARTRQDQFLRTFLPDGQESVEWVPAAWTPGGLWRGRGDNPRRHEKAKQNTESKGKEVLTTGGSRGIGRAIGQILLRIVFVVVGLLVLGAVTIAALFAVLNQTNGRIVSSGEARRDLTHPATESGGTR